MSDNLVQKLKDKMAEQRFSVAALEKEAGLKMHAVRNILHGRSKNPSIVTLKSIAKVLGCSLNELLGEEEPNAESHPAAESTYTFENRELFYAVSQLVLDMYKQTEKTIKMHEVAHLMTEIYTYSLINKKGQIDEEFSKWLFSKI